VEEHFYLVFPILYLMLRRLFPSRRHQMLALLGLCGVVLAWRLVLVFGLDAARDRTYIATDTRVDSLLFGCMLAVYGNPALDPTRISSRWWQAWWLPLGVAGLIFSVALRQPQFQETFRYTIQGLALFPLFIVAVRYPEWGPCRMLNLGWVKLIGVLSYSIYLMHTTVLFGLHQWTTWDPIIQGALALGLCLLLAKAIEHYIERPCARLRRRLSRVDASYPRLSVDHLPVSPCASPVHTPTPSATEAPWAPART
jgi:peptidoglycan/LPS O-acetylase OafA/YrhL